MKDFDVHRYWEENAENWTKLARLGYDKCRDLVNSPAFFKMLPEISGLKGLDIGCGEGHNTRIAAKSGALMHAIDFSRAFILYATQTEKNHPLGIIYQIADATNLPFTSNCFDFIISTMSMMDVANTKKAITEAYRVLKSNGFFQFSISHPLFSSKENEWLRDKNGRKSGYIIRNYFERIEGEVEEWIFGAAPKELINKMNKFRIPRFRKILSDWLNMLIDCGFTLEQFNEPYIDKALLAKYPEEYDTIIIPFFLIIRCRKA
jgi:ubiquinone/menaquinone biosynthesis C-methylase UbiE